jgi:anaerobic selenocysteine-containing dehydrogenase
VTITQTICQGCYFYCGLNVTHEGDRILRIEGMKEHPVNRGSICPKGLSGAHLVSDPRRIRAPRLRDRTAPGQPWREIGWDEALDLLAGKIEAARAGAGPESVVFHRGHAPGWVTTYNYVTRFMNALGSPNLVTHAHLCFAPRAIAHQATYGGVPEPDFDHANGIVLWGFNPVYTSLPNYASRIIAAKRRGAKLIVVDPRFTPTAAKADLWLQPHPGTDTALALGIAKVLIEEGLYDREFILDDAVGFDELSAHLDHLPYDELARVSTVSQAQMKQAARMMAEHRPTTVKEGNGLDQHVGVTQAVRGVALIASLLGSPNIEGGNVLLPPLPFLDVQLRGLRDDGWEARSLSRHPLYYRTGNALHDEDLLAALEQDVPSPVNVLIVQGGALLAANSNIARTERLLKKVGFLAVHDLYMTATAEQADLVLPAASYLERELLLYYRYRPSAQMNLVALQRPVVAPVGASRSDLDLVFDLAGRLSLHEQFPWSAPNEAFDWELAPVGIDVDYLRAHPEGYQRWYEPQELYRSHGRTGFSTPSGKVELVASRLTAFGRPGLPPIDAPPTALEPSAKYPLTCGSGLKLGIHTHTEFHSLPWIHPLEPAPFVEIHPSAAVAHNVRDGQEVELASPWGRARAVARITEAVDEGVVMLAYGYGQPYAGGRWQLSNRLTPDGRFAADPDSGATSNRRFPVRLRPIADRSGPKAETKTLALIVDPDRCVGCHTCTVACQQEHGEPRIAVHTLGPSRGDDGVARARFVSLAVDACDLCTNRLDAGRDPACADACPTEALALCAPAEIVTHDPARTQIAAIRTIVPPGASAASIH